MPDVVVNGEARHVESVCLTSLLKELDLSGRKVAIELNRRIIPQTQFSITTLSNGDVLEVVHFVGGG